jgi:XTP/dITP diphosphohydrolase
MAAGTVERLTELALATRNRDKVREIAHALQGLHLRLLEPPADYTPPAETGSTCEENAMLKARALALALGVPALADDSGLFVDALDGDPGVHSSRYAGPDATYADNVHKLLTMMQSVEEAKRSAKFICVMAVVWPHGRFELVRGECSGVITGEPRGSGGFGYDPVFLIPRLGRTFAEMDIAEKESLSHRGRALTKLVERLQRYII